jgi:murein DD-endopeptidase MepM/ murein hydrolase activator NlpD
MIFDRSKLVIFRVVARTLCLVLGFVLTIQLGVLAQPTSLEELQQQQQQLEQQRSQVTRERDRLQNLEQEAQGQLKGLHQTIKLTAEQVKQQEVRLQTATQRLRKLETTLVAAEKVYRQKQFSTVARLRVLQRQQTDRGWAVLLQSRNLNQFLDRRRQLKQVYRSDQQILVSLKGQAEQIDRQRTQVEQQKNEIALIQQQLLAQQTDFETQAVAQRELIGRLKTDRTALAAAETQLLQDSANVTTLIQERIAAQQGQTIAVRGTGQMGYPSTGEISSAFGWRVHPILGDSRFHAGLDFAADYGTAIYAADRGTVIFAGWYGGYGNAVILDHGNGITTLYAHSSEVYVVEGQTVQRGQAIAAVGSTGFSTGPHLHFEVRQDGTPIDPIAFL